MVPGKFLWKPMVQRAVTGRSRQFRLASREPGWPGPLHSPGLYLHVPFCRDLCPFCPYNRVKYREDLFARYERAVKEEVDLYAPRLAESTFGSLYVGGGTPTVDFRGLIRILQHLRKSLQFKGDICIELHPASMDEDCLRSLRDAGVAQLSIGVESLSDELLRRIGRSHDGRMAREAVQRALRTGFKSINVDLMFALPGQTLDDWISDVREVVSLGIDQVSTYPLFSFPYSDLGRTQGLRRVGRPGHRMVRAMLNFTDDHCERQGLHRCAVWSWLRPQKAKFSSITRHHYIGFGPSAASMTGADFYVNTFDEAAYAACLPHRRPVALSMPVDRRVEMAYWLYWRVYELKVVNREFQDLFGRETSVDARFGRLFRPLLATGMMRRAADGYRITRKGAYWIHRLQNEYSLNYINRLWGSCRRQPWPKEVTL